MKDINFLQVNSRDLFMLLPMLKDLYNFSVCPNILCPSFWQLVFYITVCLKHIFSFRYFFIRRFYPGTCVLIFKRPWQGGVQYRNSASESGERL